jgi:hypothetical protein|tara:strand:- start:1791 stop:3317 length:1527 start_codon:yes stop_codon:yes gene_type:complete
MQDFMGKDGFSWFVGVVEDRNDPAQLGRVRVRVLGRHSEDLSEVKTTDLPWAHVMHPVTDPSMQGLGHTPSFLTQGSWVVGFFRDDERQQPIIMGSLPGTPSSEADNSRGFNDPRGRNTDIGVQKEYASELGPTYGPYPGPLESGHGSSFASHNAVGESDTNRLALGKTSETHNSLINRRAQRLSADPVETNLVDEYDYGITSQFIPGGTGIPIATKPNIKTVSDELKEDDPRTFWNEPHPKGIVSDANPYISASYPYNHVFESESGHITEVDDSPGAERMFRQHMAGTFEEIHPDGSVVTKIIGDNYEIVIGSELIVIKGSQNITVEGSVRELIKGDYIQEIEGDFVQKIHKNHRVKVGAANDAHPKGPGGNREEEIIGSHSFNINDDIKGRVGGDSIISFEKSKTQIVGGSYDLDVTGKLMDSNPGGNGIFIQTGSDYFVFAKSHVGVSTISGIMSVRSGNTLNIMSTNAMVINSEASIDSTAGTVYTIKSGGGTPTSINRVDINP